MKTIKRIRHSIRIQMWYIAFATAAILAVPLIAMQFTEEVNWGILDFIVMGALLLGAGIIYILISRVSESTVYRTAVGLAATAILLLIWVNLAVGIIGSPGNPANFLYVAVIAISIIGAGISRLQPNGMSRTMAAAAVAQLLIPVIVLIVSKSSLEESPGVLAVFGLNAIFAVMFAVSALLFRNSAQKQTAD